MSCIAELQRLGHLNGEGQFQLMTPTTHEERLLQIETARIRHAWAKSQVLHGETTPALLKYLKDSLDELAVLRANDTKLRGAT